MMPIPDGPTLFISEHERIITFHHLPREDEVGPALLHFRASEGDFIAFAEAHAHVVEEGLRAKVYIDCVRPVLHQQVRDPFALPFGGSLSSSTVPLNLASVRRSYLGGPDAGGWLFCA